MVLGQEALEAGQKFRQDGDLTINLDSDTAVFFHYVDLMRPRFDLFERLEAHCFFPSFFSVEQ